MLQGFHWRSSKINWYQIIQQNAQRIKDSGFTVIWFPPPSDCADYEGYLPRELDKLDSNYGSAIDLRNAIQWLQPEVKAIADIVINHRVGSQDFADFKNPTWSTYSIASNDEYQGPKSFNWDTGEPYHAGRDLDHKNPEVSNSLIRWMNDLKDSNIAGFAGWRYDLVKGYAGSATELYNRQTQPIFSVGEYFDYNTQKIINWIDSTHPEPAFRSKAFDFPLRNALYSAVAWKNFQSLNAFGKAPGILGVWSDKAVTFLENHDTEEVRGGEYAPYFPGGEQMIQGYAYLLTHPGIPCVFWKDIYDSGKENENKIRQLIEIRKQYKINSKSKLYIALATKNRGYAAYIQGDNGEVAMKIGPGSWQPSGSKWQGVGDLIISGKDFAVWGENGKFW